MLITILMFIFPKYLPAKFLWQIWSHNLGFLKLIEILWSGTLLYACYSFNVYVFKILFIQFFSYFLSKFGPQIWHSSDLLKFVTEVDCYMLTSILMFIFSKLLLFILFGQIWSQNLNFYKSTQIWYKRPLLYAYYDFNEYLLKFFVSQIFWGQIWSHNLQFYKMIKIS